MPVIVRKLRVTKRKKSINGIRGIESNIGYRRGRIDGFNRGKQKGFNQGRQVGQEQGRIRALQDQKLNALVITPGIIPSLEIGIIQPLNELNRQTGYRFDVKVEGEVTKDWLTKADTVIFLRNVEPEAYQYLEWAHEMGKRTIYVVDDNFLEIPATTPTGVYYNDPVRRETFIKFLRNAQLVKVDASFFGDYIRTHFNSNVIYFPASVDFSWLEQVEKPEREDGQVVIGYAGTAKEDDFSPVVDALSKILYEYGGFVRLEFMGYVPAQFAGHPSVSVIEVDPGYRSYIQRLHQCTWDIGLAPLEDTLFNNCKTNNKFREYAACLIPGIYSEMPVYKEWVVHGETGFLVPHTAKGWHSGIKSLIENSALRSAIRDRAGAFARQHFAVQDCAERWRNHVLQA